MTDAGQRGDKYAKTEPTRYFIVGIRYFSVLQIPSVSVSVFYKKASIR